MDSNKTISPTFESKPMLKNMKSYQTASSDFFSSPSLVMKEGETNLSYGEAKFSPIKLSKSKITLFSSPRKIQKKN